MTSTHPTIHTPRHWRRPTPHRLRQQIGYCHSHPFSGGYHQQAQAAPSYSRTGTHPQKPTAPAHRSESRRREYAFSSDALSRRVWQRTTKNTDKKTRYKLWAGKGIVMMLLPPPLTKRLENERLWMLTRSCYGECRPLLSFPSL